MKYKQKIRQMMSPTREPRLVVHEIRLPGEEADQLHTYEQVRGMNTLDLFVREIRYGGQQIHVSYAGGDETCVGVSAEGNILTRPYNLRESAGLLLLEAVLSIKNSRASHKSRN